MYLAMVLLLMVVLPAGAVAVDWMNGAPDLVVLIGKWFAPAAIVGGLFYGLAGVQHIVQGNRNTKEHVAMLTNLFAFVVLAGYLAALVFA